MISYLNDSSLYLEFILQYTYEGDQETIQTSITRNIILREGKRLGIVVKSAEVEALTEKIIMESFDGSEEDFLIALEYYNISLEEFYEDAHLDLLVRELLKAKNISFDEESIAESFDELLGELWDKARQEFIESKN